MPTPRLTATIISAAIDGLEGRKTQIDVQIAELRAMLNGGPAEPTIGETPEAAPQQKRRKFSRAALRRMREAQQRRWAKVRGDSEAPAPATTPAPQAKRKMSAAGRAAIAVAAKKRWAAVHKAENSAPKKAPAKKKMSPARKAALVANLAKARAARRAAA